MTKTTTMTKTAATKTTLTESEAALLAAQQERQRILDAIAEVEKHLDRLDLATHLASATAALDAAVDTGDAANIQAAAQALQAAKVESDVVGAQRLAAQARARTLRAALERADTTVGAAKRQVLREKDERLMDELDAEWGRYEKLLQPMITAHLRLAYLANEVWRVRAEILGTRQVNYCAPLSHFSLPVPNGSMPNLPLNARADKMLSRTVDVIAPAQVIPGTPPREWTDRDLIERVRSTVEEV